MADRQKVDVVIAGAGPAGLVAALALTARGFSVFIADTAPEASAKASSGRSAALLNSTVSVLTDIGVWDACADVSAPLEALQFIDDTGRIFRAPDTVFRASEIGEKAFGYNIANADLVRVLRADLEGRGVAIQTPGPVKTIAVETGAITVRFGTGVEAEANLAIAADGKTSPLRDAAGIRTLPWSYDQTAVATSFSHERPHHGVCIEVHRAAGPFTLVPLPGNRSSLVWVERKAKAQELAALDGPAFAREVEAVSRRALGTVFDVLPRAAFPLSSLIARDYGRNRMALVGEAAHVTPPIGAQGLNLGFRDVERLTALVTEARGDGADIGGETLLQTYGRARRGDIVTRTLGVDLLNRSLLSDFLPFAVGRGLGLMALSANGAIRRAFMRRGIAPAG